jgi:hypothetical protein
VIAALALITGVARAEIDPRCRDVLRPDDYDEQTQRDFLENNFALATTLSPIHAPLPHAAGHGAVGLDFLVIPPLPCARRFALSHTKTEDTNKTPVAPRPRVTFALDGPGPTVLSGGFAYVPPVTVFGTRNVIVAGEFGVGAPFGGDDKLQAAVRVHATLMKTIADIATSLNPSAEPVDDLFVASTFGGDASFGYAVGMVTPYVVVGVTDVSTVFYVGDDGVIGNNVHPYIGPVASLGADALVHERIRLAGEVYVAPGGHSTLDHDTDTMPGFGHYGHFATARFRAAVEF